MTLNIILATVTGAAITALVAVLLFRRPRKKKRVQKAPMEFSKKIFIGLSVLVGGVAIFVCVMVWRTEDVSITQGLIDGAFGLLKVGVVSYFGKAALENKIKLASIYPKLKEQIFCSGGDAQ
jgi:multisubunit Na+/H+ antiporter MnhC subunit